MANDENIPAMLLNGFNPTPDTRSDEQRRQDILNEAMVAVLVELPESAFTFDIKKQVYVCKVGEYTVELRRSSYEGLKYMRSLKR